MRYIHLTSLLYNFRKSSLTRGSTLTGGRVQDTRDVQSKSFLNTGATIILKYLLEHGFSSVNLSSKKLISPSVKEFKSITEFLFKQVDPNFPVSEDVIADEDIITMFRQLGYPTPISKSNIVSAGTMHAWPHLMAALTWLIELLSYDEAVSSEATRTEESDETSDAFMHQFMGSSYIVYMKGEDSKVEELREEFMSGFERKNSQIEEQMKMLEDRNATLSADIAVVQNRRAELPKLIEKKDVYEKDAQKFDELLGTLEDHKIVYGQKTQDREGEMTKLTKALNDINADIASLRRKIENQEMKPEDVEIMVAERRRIEESQKKASEKRKLIQRKKWESENKLKDNVNAIKDAKHAYIAIAKDLKLIPATERNARGRDFTLEISAEATTFDDFIETDIPTLLNNIASLNKELEHATSKLHTDVEKKQEAADEIEQNRQDLEQKARAAKDKIQRLEETYKLEKDQLDGLIAMHGKEMQEMEERLIVARDSGAEEARAAAAQRQANGIAATQEALRAEHEQTKSAIIAAIETVALECAAHRELMSKRLHDIKALHEKELQSQMESHSELTRDAIMPPLPPY
jgi:kinetochore protein NDC80